MEKPGGDTSYDRSVKSVQKPASGRDKNSRSVSKDEKFAIHVDVYRTLKGPYKLIAELYIKRQEWILIEESSENNIEGR